MFYNTKVEPLFDTASKKRGKNMFYNIFLDLNQKMRGVDSDQKRDGGRVAGVRIAGWAWIRKPNNATITEAGNARLTFRNTIAPVC